jgi:DME family drug/metabolite transporter
VIKTSIPEKLYTLHWEAFLFILHGMTKDKLGGSEKASYVVPPHPVPRFDWKNVWIRTDPSKRLRGYLLVLVAACLWATIGLWYRVLVTYDLAQGVIVAYRAGIAACILFVAIWLVNPRSLHVHRRDWPYFGFFGTIGVAGFYLCYMQATVRGSLAVAAVLLYTAPIWITIWSVLRQGEALTKRRLIALGLAFAGCALVANIFDPANLSVNGLAILFSLLSGLGYAAYSLWSAEGTRRGYSAWTVVAYALGIGALVVFAFQPLDASLQPLYTPAAWPYLFGVAFGPSLLAPVCFTLGLQYIRTSNASILATIEPVVAALLGWLIVVPPEPLTALQIIGGGCVLAAVIVLTGDFTKD